MISQRVTRALRYKAISVLREADSVATRLIGKRRVFVATWIEGKNFGDDYLSLALSNYLNARFSQVKTISVDLRASNYRLTEDDVLLIGGGGLWGPHGGGHLNSRLYEAWMNTRAELIIGNIGTESFDKGSARQLLTLRDKASFFSVRDRESWAITKEILGEDRVVWGADSTYLSPIRVAREPQANCIAVNLCAPVPGEKQYRIGEIVAGVSRLSKAGYRIRGSVLSYQNSESDYQFCKQIDPNCVDEFSIEPYRDCELLIAMRFHSVLMALQNEIPVIAINYSAKVERVMKEYGLEEYCLEPDDDDLADKLATLVKTIDKPHVLEKMRQGNMLASQRLIPFETHLTKMTTYA